MFRNPDTGVSEYRTCSNHLEAHEFPVGTIIRGDPPCNTIPFPKPVISGWPKSSATKMPASRQFPLFQKVLGGKALSLAATPSPSNSLSVAPPGELRMFVL